MKSHLELDDLAFEKSFTTCMLDSKLFTHEAHLRLAWIQIRNHGLDTAIVAVKKQIKNYVRSIGEAPKFNETVTVAAVNLVNQCLIKNDKDNFVDFIAEHPQLNENFKDLLMQHYSIDIFESDQAKNEFIQPDIIPFG